MPHYWLHEYQKYHTEGHVTNMYVTHGNYKTNNVLKVFSGFSKINSDVKSISNFSGRRHIRHMISWLMQLWTKKKKAFGCLKSELCRICPYKGLKSLLLQFRLINANFNVGILLSRHSTLGSPRLGKCSLFLRLLKSSRICVAVSLY